MSPVSMFLAFMAGALLALGIQVWLEKLREKLRKNELLRREIREALRRGWKL